MSSEVEKNQQIIDQNQFTWNNSIITNHIKRPQVNLTKELIEKLISGEFNHDFINVTLTQQKTKNPEVFTGSGCFYYKDKKPYLKLLHKESDPQFRVYPTYSSLNNGELIREEHLFSMTATDLNGHIWHADNVNPYPYMQASSCGIIINCELYTISRISEDDYTDYRHSFFVPQTFNIPCNKFQDLGEDGKRRTKCEFTLNQINITIQLEDDYSYIQVASNKVVTVEQARSILDALSIAEGMLLTPALTVTQSLDRKSLIFNKVSSLSKIRLMSYIPQRAPNYLSEWIEFIKSYTTKFGVDKTFYYYWLKVFNAHQSDLENETLSLTVSIEGVVNKFHSNFRKEDCDFKKMCSDVEPVIDSLKINERVKSSIIGFLQRNGQSSPRGTLFNMAQNGIFPKELATIWNKARNTSAHAEQFKKHLWLDNVNNYTSCLSLFYILLSYHIEYTGLFYHHHLPSAPLEKLNFDVNEIEKDAGN